MHKYLRAVGFSQYEKKSQVDSFFKENLKEEHLTSTYITQDMRLCGQYNIPVCNGAGISVIGEQEKDQLALIDFYYPYLKGYDYTLIQECTIEKHSDKESYAGIIDDYRLGIALIFYLTNGNVYNSLIKTHKNERHRRAADAHAPANFPTTAPSSPSRSETAQDAFPALP